MYANLKYTPVHFKKTLMVFAHSFQYLLSVDSVPRHKCWDNSDVFYKQISIVSWYALWHYGGKGK